MQLIRGLHNLKRLPASVVTIGNFDGVHLGHQSLLRDLKHCAHACQALSVLIIFEPHPLELFLKNKAPARLMKLREKLLALQDYAIDYVVCLKFDAQLAGLEPEAFVKDILVDRLNCKAIVVGDDFRFGKKRAGDVPLLCRLGKQYGFRVDQLPTLTQSADRVSSTRIRELLADNALLEAKALLTRAYSLIGKVVHGDKIGRTLGFPTANIYLHRQVVALHGVFVVRVRIQGEPGWYFGAANLGTRPAVGGERILLEVYLFDFERDIYAQTIEVQFLHKLRDEQPCESLAALKDMIAADVLAARKWLTTYEVVNEVRASNASTSESSTSG